MSEQAVAEFLREISEDSALEEELRASVVDTANQHEAIAAFARKRGHDFTSADLGRALEAHRAQAELGDQELESISGGFQPQPEPPGNASFLLQKVRLPSWFIR